MPDNAKPLVLLTRPQAQAERFGDDLRNKTGGTVDILIAPLLRIDLLALPEIPADAALVFTSENGVRAYVEGGGAAGRTAYCVGDRTARAARAAGLMAYSADGSAKDLHALIQARSPAQPLVHLHGRHLSADLATLLRDDGFDATGVSVYDQHALPLPAAARAALMSTQEVLVPLFSPRSAALFAQAVPDGAKCRLLCISPATRAALPNALAQRATVTGAPTGAAMLNTLARQLSP